jgi:hypothetical protein
MPPFKIQYRRRGARKWLADPHRRFYGDRATAEGQITDADREHWEVRVVEILGDVEPDYRARLQLEGHWEPTPWPETPALRWTVYLASAAVRDFASLCMTRSRRSGRTTLPRRSSTCS